jgi:hypothetical protein
MTARKFVEDNSAVVHLYRYGYPQPTERINAGVYASDTTLPLHQDVTRGGS